MCIRDSSKTTASAGVVIGVMGAVGGVGASTLAAVLARKRSAHNTTVLIDGVPSSGGIDLLVGAEETLGAVSYTHLDVYKRQGSGHAGAIGGTSRGRAKNRQCGFG